MKRETFGSRLGFILVSAGCAVGIGNVWKFPYMCGQFGGAAFILIYLVFLLIMGIPVNLVSDVPADTVLPLHMRHWNQKEQSGILRNGSVLSDAIS